MKKLLIFIVITAITAAAYYSYKKLYNKGTVDLWSLVPQHALVVYESTKPAETYNNVLETSVGKTFLAIDEGKHFNNELQSLDTVGGAKGTLGVLLNGEFLLSAHVTTKNKFGITYYKELNNNKQKEDFTRLIDIYKKKSNYSFSTRKYQAETIYELTEKKSKSVFSYFIQDNILVASFTPFLVEDVIRLLKDESGSFKYNNSSLFKLPRLSNDEGNVYANTARLNQFLKVFGAFGSGNFYLGKSSFLDLNIDNKGIYLNGFTEYSSSDFLSTFSDQKPVSTNIKYFVPNNASYLLQFSFDRPARLFDRWEEFLNQNNPSYVKSREKFISDNALKGNLGYTWVKNTIGLVQLESDQGQLLYIEGNDINEALNELNTLGESFAQALGDSVYVERYANYEIREMGVMNYPKYKFMPFMEDIQVSYYTVFENYIVFSNSIQNLKSLINDIDVENTWGRSVNYNSFLERTLEESNISLIANTERFLENTKEDIDPYWVQLLNNNLNSINNFHLVSFQMSKLDENFYTSIVVEHTERQEVVAQNFEIVLQALLDNKATSKPYVVRNHISNLREVVVVDSTNSLNLISNNGQVLWSKPINGQIIGDLKQVDYYNNNKLQYYFATANALHIVDRNGSYIEGYPKSVDTNIVFANVIDYDNSKRYRFLMADDRGNVYLYNKEGKPLDGWNPRKLPGTLTSTPFHVRVRRKDCFVTTLSNGQVALLNRRGEYLPGFPLDLEAKLNTNVHVKIGSDLSSTHFYTITRDGRLIKFSMTGEILETNQLYKPTKESEFKIVSDELNKGYIIVRRDLNRVVILNENLQEVLAKDYFDAEQMLVQFYYFSSLNKLYAITDKTQGFTYLYNNSGRLINSRPVNSDFEVGIIYSQLRDDLKVYCISNKDFKILQFK